MRGRRRRWVGRWLAGRGGGVGAAVDFSEDLGERDLQILNERILADEPRTLAEMGEEFGVSRERVRQLEARIIKKLREYMKEKLVDFELYAEDPDL